MEDLIDSIDEYNAAIELRNDPPVRDPAFDKAAQTVVESHHLKFVLNLERLGGGHE